jgi:hypothetical protein
MQQEPILAEAALRNLVHELDDDEPDPRTSKKKKKDKTKRGYRFATI